MHVDRTLSKRIARRTKTEQRHQPACYALLDYDELSIGRYVEGCTFDEAGRIVDYGWVERGDKTIDPVLYEHPLTHHPQAAFQQKPSPGGLGQHPKARVLARGPANLLPVWMSRA
jgi:hypothetical protein